MNNRIRPGGLWIGLIGVLSVALVSGIAWAMLASGPGEPEPSETTAAPQSAGPEDIVCSDFSQFSGKFVEDRSDYPVENVAAMLVTNRSDQYLDLATLTYLVDGKAATFVVTGLPPGKSAWVLEKDRLTVGADAVFQRQNCVTAFRAPSGFTGEIDLMSDGNNLTAVNRTDGTLKDVYVYYKALHTDGNFFGGITYRVGFGDLPPGQAVEKLAGHYTSEGAQVVRITWQEE